MILCNTVRDCSGWETAPALPQHKEGADGAAVWVLWPGAIRHSAAIVAEPEPVGATPNTALYSVIHDILIARWTK